MGMAKRLLEEGESQHREAIDIAVKAGVLVCCEWHGEVYDPCDPGIDSSLAYRRANAMFSQGRLTNRYSSRRQLTDGIKNAIESAPMSCGWCDKTSTNDAETAPLVDRVAVNHRAVFRSTVSVQGMPPNHP